MCQFIIYYVMCSRETKILTTYDMREWLSGRASPCQGEGRGFESRLALNKKQGIMQSMVPCFL